MSRNPILTLRLLNEALPAKAGFRIDRLVKAKDLLRRYPEACAHEGVDIELFHNDQIRYSGIQVDQYQGATEWTAIGLPAVKALVLWYQIAQYEQLIDCKNVVESTEFYTPAFLQQARCYRILHLIPSKNLLKEMGQLKTVVLQKSRLEKYLYGNLMTFLNYIGFHFDKEQHFLQVKIHQFKIRRQSIPLFHHRQRQSCQIDFSLNFMLPQTLRLGQSTALGYGQVVHL